MKKNPNRKTNTTCVLSYKRPRFKHVFTYVSLCVDITYEILEANLQSKATVVQGLPRAGPWNTDELRMGMGQLFK